MARLSLTHRVQWLPVAVTAACTAALALLLFTGVRLAARLQSTSSALQLASSMTAQPQFLRSELTLIQRGLETRTYVGNSLRALAASRAASNDAYLHLASAMSKGGLAGRPDIAALFASASARWRPVNEGLAGLEQAKATDLYVDSANGSSLSTAGKALKRTVDDLLVTQTRTTAELAADLGNLAAQLREIVVRDGQSLRGLLLGGAGLATVLLATMLYFAWRASRAADSATAAQGQIENILGTVREGLFLIDRDGRIGSAYSDSLLGLLHTTAPAGQSLEDLLRPLVDERTLLGASKYVGLFWKDNVNEELIESVNPLNQIEVSFQRKQGPAEIRYLSFSFRRARGAGANTDFLLGAVADITDRVLLQQELEQLRSGSDSHAELLLQLLRTDSLQLHSFLNNVDVAVRHSNALLRSPGIKQADLQSKIQGVFREMHALKGEAAALGLDSFVQRGHAVETLLNALRERPELAGDDFVPVVVKLDELLRHMQIIASMRDHMGEARPRMPAVAEQPPERHGDTSVISPKVTAPQPAPLEVLLQRLAHEVAASRGGEIRLMCEGLDKVPGEYQGPVRDICIQMVRNAIAHGIESAEERAAAGKPPLGTVRVRFSDSDSREYSVLVEDDGQGLNPTRIRKRALERGLLDEQQAANLDRSGTYRMIFQSGFSTATEVDEHAGRGIGLDVVNSKVRECGGRIGIATSPGKYTRFKVLLPRRVAADSSRSTAA
jgi:HPt (histidine-containing phosphotransfer) domain-containing protein